MKILTKPLVLAAIKMFNPISIGGGGEIRHAAQNLVESSKVKSKKKLLFTIKEVKTEAWCIPTRTPSILLRSNLPQY